MSSRHIFIESICFRKGNYQLLDYHQQRVNETFAHFFGGHAPLNLKEILPPLSSTPRRKVRLVYDHSDFEIDVKDYQPKKINLLQVVHHDMINYAFKHGDRSLLDQLFAKVDTADDMIVVKNGKLTDSYYANLAFWDGNNWYTPETCLLPGVKRQALIDEGQLTKAPIGISDIYEYQSVSLINAMLDLAEIEVPISNIRV